ncbi:MAG: DUF2975 domain-containing protein [Solobacterium sp.]|nr:DUF2975 domain-containing protein [Solobacterium sp.]
MKNESMIKIAGRMYTLVNILEKVVGAGGLLCLVAIPLLLLVPQGSTMTSNALTLGNVTLELYEGALEEQPIQVWLIMITLVSTAVMLGVIFYAMRTIRNILLPMKEGNPFDQSVASRIRTLGHLVFWGGLLSQIAVNLSGVLFTSQYDSLLNLFQVGVVKSVRINYTFSVTFLFFAFVLYLLSYVFEYGQELQRESDETL